MNIFVTICVWVGILSLTYQSVPPVCVFGGHTPQTSAGLYAIVKDRRVCTQGHIRDTARPCKPSQAVREMLAKTALHLGVLIFTNPSALVCVSADGLQQLRWP